MQVFEPARVPLGIKLQLHNKTLPISNPNSPQSLILVDCTLGNVSDQTESI